MKKSNILINNTIINYCRYEGTSDFTILFLHGWGRDLNDWKGYFELCETKKISFLAIDLPGFGKSGKPLSDRGIENYSEIVIKLLDKLSMKKIILIGHSFGGRIAFWMAANYPDKLEKLILIAPGGVEKTISDSQKKIINAGKMVFGFPGLNIIGNRIKKRIQSSDYKNTSGVMKDVFVKIVNQDLTYLFKRIKIPVIIFRGELDDQIEKWKIEVMKANITNAEINIYKGEGHDLHKNIVGSVLDYF